MVRVRFAPSPTGVPHIGNTRTALFNYLFTKHHRGRFILRIEDTDRDRLVPESLPKILQILKAVGIHWDEGPYIQSRRLKIYRHYAETLVKTRAAYYIGKHHVPRLYRRIPAADPRAPRPQC